MAETKTLTTKKQGLLKATSLVSTLTFASRMLGFARDMLLASFFGAQAGIDAFYVAFRIPNFMRRLFAEGAFSQAFVPVLSEYQQTRTELELKTFLDKIMGSLSLVLLIITIIGVLAAPVIIFLFAPGFGAGSYRTILATEMLRVTFPYLMLISLTAMGGAILNTFGYFGVPAFTPVILNICMIAAAYIGVTYCAIPVTALAWGVFAAGLLQLLFELPFLKQKGLLPRPRVDFRDPGVKRVLALMVPALFGVSVAQINLMVDSIFASFLPVGSVSWLYYTDRLTDFPLGVFGVAIATVILPHLSRQFVDGDDARFSNAMDWGIRMVLLIGVPAAIGLSVFSMPMIATCFAYGKFVLQDVLQTQKSLIALGIGVPAFMLVKILASGFYAGQDIKTPVRVGIWSMVFNSLMCASLVSFLAHAGLALASSLAGFLNAGILLYLLIKQGRYVPGAGWPKFLAQLGLANLCLAVFLWFSMGDTVSWLACHPLERLGLLLGKVGLSVLLYLGVLYISGLRIQEFRGDGRVH